MNDNQPHPTPIDSYRIPDSKTLIIVDAHDTILQRDLSRSTDDVFGDPRQGERVQWHLREGLLNFIEYFNGIHKKRIVISSDGGRQKLRGVFRRFGIQRQLAGVYGGEHLHRTSYLKQLDLIMRDLGAVPEETVFIGDSRIDRLSAEQYGVDFIEVPRDPKFSFNAFIRLSPADPFGLAIQRLTNTREVFHNLSSPELVERALLRSEGRLSHLGPLTVDTGKFQNHIDDLYIVREPSSEHNVYWGGRFRSFGPARFHQLFLRLQAFLQDRDLFLQDCYAGADPRYRFPLRVITQTAWHNLYARNTFIQAHSPAELDDLPEYTVIHVPHFRAIPEIDGTEGEAFLILNLARKTALIGGTELAGEIRFAAYNLLGFFFARADVLPLRCSSNRDDRGQVSLFCGKTSLSRSTLALDPDRIFFGDAHHCWTDEGLFNLEWGCYEPIQGLREGDNPALFQTTRKFGTIIENVAVDEGRHLHLGGPAAPGSIGARASFPITHLGRADRSGRAEQPRHLFVLVGDGRGILPALARFTPELAVLWLLAGYDSGPAAGEDEATQENFARTVRFSPFYGELPILFHPAVYALLFWQKLKSSGATCWLLNLGDQSRGPEPDPTPETDLATWRPGNRLEPAVARRLVNAVHAGWFDAPGRLRPDPFWDFECAAACPDVPDEVFAPWSDTDRFEKARARLRSAVRAELDTHRQELDRELLRAFPGGADE